MTLLEEDRKRMPSGKLPKFQVYMRKYQESKFKPIKLIYRILFKFTRDKRLNEISINTQIGGGLYMGHANLITINPHTIIGKNVNIHKGVTIGQENRGKRKGTPIIGDSVWIGINSTIVGKIVIGDDVLIAPNSYVNCDVPSHSIVIGNPCKIIPRANATEDYINHKI